VFRVEIINDPTTNRAVTKIHANWVLDPTTIIPRGVNNWNIKYVALITAQLPGEILVAQVEGIIAENPDILVVATDATTVSLFFAPPEGFPVMLPVIQPQNDHIVHYNVISQLHFLLINSDNLYWFYPKNRKWSIFNAFNSHDIGSWCLNKTIVLGKLSCM
jgi:hypothetical protein